MPTETDILRILPGAISQINAAATAFDEAGKIENGLADRLNARSEAIETAANRLRRTLGKSASPI